MKSIELLKKLDRYELFSENDVVRIIDKNKSYAKLLLHRLYKNNLVKRIERGKYTIHDDAMIFASSLVKPSYISLISAFRYYGFTQKQPVNIYILSPVSKKSINFGVTKIIFLRTKHLYGYGKERYGDFDILIAEPEKAIIDALLFKLPLQDIIDALDTAKINYEKLINYAVKTKNKSLIKRLGYIIESKTGKDFGLKPLDANYIKLDYLSRNTGRKNKKWRLILNNTL